VLLRDVFDDRRTDRHRLADGAALAGPRADPVFAIEARLRSSVSGAYPTRFRSPTTSRMTTASRGDGRSKSRRHTSSSPSWVRVMKARRRLVKVQCCRERQRP
jgi:hypothetical protein